MKASLQGHHSLWKSCTCWAVGGIGHKDREHGSPGCAMPGSNFRWIVPFPQPAQLSLQHSHSYNLQRESIPAMHRTHSQGKAGQAQAAASHVCTHLDKAPQPGTLLPFKILPARKCTFQPPATPETKNELKSPAEN